MDSGELSERSDLSWDYLKTFLLVARRGSFRAVSQQDGVVVNTARRHITGLEEKLGVVLFLRNPNGLELTEDGRRIYESAERMERAARVLQLQLDPDAGKVEGMVRISVTEGLGTVWLMPQAVSMQKEYPRLIFHIENQMHTADLARCQADLSIQLDEPTNPDVKIVKLGRIHIMPFAAKSYIAAHGKPHNLLACRKHKIVMQHGPQMHPRKYLQKFTDYLLAKNTSIITNTSAAHYYAIKFGAGIGFLPTYAALLSDDIEAVNIGRSVQRDILLAYHPDVRRIKRVAVVIDWAKHIFDGDKYPWFRDEFIHPDDLPSRISNPEVLTELRRFGT